MESLDLTGVSIVLAFCVVAWLVAVLHFNLKSKLPFFGNGFRAVSESTESSAESYENKFPVTESLTETPKTEPKLNLKQQVTLSEIARLADYIRPFGFEFTKANKAIPFLADSLDHWHYVEFRPGVHWGIFGITGGGKGNLLQHIALHALSLGPRQIELTVVDAKYGLDYSFCKKIQHAEIYAAKKVSEGLDSLIKKMNNRLDLLERAECRDLLEYNKRYAAKALPLMVIILDEIADFTKNDREMVATLARMGRAAGIVLFVATQYPTVDVLPSQVQANVTNRVVFRLATSEHIRVAMRRDSDSGTFDPAMIAETMPGVAVWRNNSGKEILGRTPDVTDAWRLDAISVLSESFPKIEIKVNGLSESLPETAETETEEFETDKTDFEKARVLHWLKDEPNISAREVARRLWGGDGGGKRGVQASELLKQMRAVHVHLFPEESQKTA